jgi:hypothetical protein
MIHAFYMLFDLLKVATPLALFTAAIVFISILAMRLLEVLPTSKWARAANLTFSVLLSGVLVGTVTQEEVVIIAMTTTFSASFWKVSKIAYEYITKNKAFPEIDEK